MIEIQAVREAQPGIAFPPDTDWLARVRGRASRTRRRPTSSRRIDEIKARHGTSRGRWTA